MFKCCTTKSMYPLMQAMNDSHSGVPDCYGISVWDLGVTQPSYNVRDRIWSFIYDNGSPAYCDNITRKITNNWRCNKSAGDYVVTYFGEPNDQCVYQLNIDSSLA